jgi:ppGpp synthetase/RelA/SpoT-type nucleotidyltranferase
MNTDIQEAVQAYKDKQFEYKQFLAGVKVFFEEHPELNKDALPIVHSIKSRLKDPAHLEDKLKRKLRDGISITKENIFSKITDLVGVRILHLYQDQFPTINEAIHQKIENGDWVFVEPPTAFTWDHESQQFYESLNIVTELRATYYTSIHYVIKPNNKNSSVCCEIQVRTLFEEIWGEIDHSINYPHPTNSIACKEQLRVLSKLVLTGTRLADSIFRSNIEHHKSNK